MEACQKRSKALLRALCSKRDSDARNLRGYISPTRVCESRFPHACQFSCNKVIDLTEEIIKKLEVRSLDGTNTPDSLDLFAYISAESRSAIDAGDFKLLVGPRVGAIGAGRTIGRFAHALGKSAIDGLSKMEKACQRKFPNALLADISFWTNHSRLANVAIAPCPNEYAVVAGCRPIPDHCNIALSDIVIGIENGSFYARWIVTGERIIARSRSMLTEQVMPEVIRFLVDIGMQGKRYLAPFDWGFAAKLPYLPRVTSGKVILSPAKWKLSSDTELSDSVFRSNILAWQRDYSVPNGVLVTEKSSSDNQLLLDLSKESDLEMLKASLKENGEVTLLEYIPVETWHDKDGHHFVTEIVTSFERIDEEQEKGNRKIQEKQIKLLRREDFLLPPGRDWLYLRLEASQIVHEELIKLAADKIAQLKQSGLVEEWFFIRYADPEHHLRIRIKVSNDNLYSRVFEPMCSWAREAIFAGIAKEFSIETYDREIERYGGVEGIRIVEGIFCAESDVLSKVFGIIEFSEVDRAIVGVYLANCLLESLGLDRQRAWECIRSTISISEKKLFSKDSRELKPQLIKLIDDKDSKSIENEFKWLYTATESFTQRMHSLGFTLSSMDSLNQTCEHLSNSMIHMLCNRLFGINSKAEIRTRVLLANTLESLMKRNRET